MVIYVQENRISLTWSAVDRVIGSSDSRIGSCEDRLNRSKNGILKEILKVTKNVIRTDGSMRWRNGTVGML